MRNSYKYLVAIIIGILLLVGCNSTEDIDTDTVDAKKPEEQMEKEFDENGDIAEGSAKVEKEDDVWTYFENATWEGEFNGLVTKIEKVVVAEDAPYLDSDGKESERPAVGIKVILENTSDKVMDSSIDFATLITSTGEQVTADLLFSDDIGGDIHEGVIKEGDVIFYLDRGEVVDITWIKLEWDSMDVEINESGDYDNAYHTESVELDLAK